MGEQTYDPKSELSEPKDALPPVSLEELPENARKYLKVMEELCGAPVHIVSTGPDRAENIIIQYPYDL